MAKKDKTKTSKEVTKTTTPTATEVTKTATPEETVVSLGDSFTELLGQLQTLRTQLTGVTGQVRMLQKRADRELKNAHKAGRKGKRAKGNRAPSGFVKPTKISSELATFLGKAKGTEMARTEVTKEINGYIRQHNLQDPKNGRIILADTKLRKLLKLNKTDELTYFNLQRYMSPHFEKKNAKVDTSN
jgi:upstream activation factor subunit UAF30